MGRDISLERAWRERIGRQQRSGLTVQQFCEQESLVAHQFSWWKRELNRRDACRNRRRNPNQSSNAEDDGGRAGAGFVAVQVAATANGNPPLEIIVDQRLRIAVTAGFDHQLLTEVVRMLENRQC